MEKKKEIERRGNADQRKEKRKKTWEWKKEKKKLPTENHCFRSSSFESKRVFISRAHPLSFFCSLSLSLSRFQPSKYFVLFSQACFSMLFLFIYPWSWIELALFERRLSQAHATLTLCFPDLAFANRSPSEIYARNLESRLRYRNRRYPWRSTRRAGYSDL